MPAGNICTEVVYMYVVYSCIFICRWGVNIGAKSIRVKNNMLCSRTRARLHAQNYLSISVYKRIFFFDSLYFPKIYRVTITQKHFLHPSHMTLYTIYVATTNRTCYVLQSTHKAHTLASKTSLISNVLSALLLYLFIISLSVNLSSVSLCDRFSCNTL